MGRGDSVNYIDVPGLRALAQPGPRSPALCGAFVAAPRIHDAADLRGNIWLLLHDALVAIGDGSLPREVLMQASEWLHRTARQHVPPQFRDSFLGRNAVNRKLLLLSLRASIAPPGAWRRGSWKGPTALASGRRRYRSRLRAFKAFFSTDARPAWDAQPRAAHRSMLLPENANSKKVKLSSITARVLPLK